MYTRSVRYISLCAVVLCMTVALLLLLVPRAAAEVDTERPATFVIVTESGEKYTYTDELITPSDFTVQEEIERRKINAPLREKIALVDLWLAKGADYNGALNVCFPRLNAVVQTLADKLYVEPVDATVEYKNGKFTVTQHKSGRLLDENKLYASIYCALKFTGGGTVKADTVTVEPQVTKPELERNLVIRSSYATDYSTSNAARAHNVTLALKKFDGAVVAPGEAFSFNGIVGARTEENGFDSAKIIVDGKYTTGVGGGVCQASTAVYNAALLAGLHATANAHSICPSYCPPGLDAMISGYSDLVVRNITSHNIYISVRVSGGKGTVTIFGEPNEFTIVPESVIVKTVEFDEEEIADTEHKYFDETSVSGDRLLVSPGKNGIVSETYLKYYKDGRFVKRVKIRTNEYRSTPQVVAVAP